MAKPRIFVSSTYYDLRHVRASLETFIQSLGYEPILSEKGDIVYSPDIPLDEACYREAGSADMLVLIIGGSMVPSGVNPALTFLMVSSNDMPASQKWSTKAQ